MTNSKSIISYNGGSAGDLFTLSCNGNPLLGLKNAKVSQPATLKNYEALIQKDIPASLDTELLNIVHPFVNTHLLDEVVDKGFDVYNVVITDPEIQLYTIYRQMQIQKLRILINTDHIWFNTVREFCLKKEFILAAEYWFANAKKIWLDRMEYRIKFDKCKQLNFNKLYTTDFVDDLKNQGWTHNISLLASNHKEWLKVNKDFSYQKTIDIMSYKLSTMNWHQIEGWIEFTTNATHTVQSAINTDVNIEQKQWVFDNSVADRFQHEAETNIPSYTIVVDKCLQFADKHLEKSDKIIDVGSALGYTMDKFITAGFTDVLGVDNSPSMNKKNKYSTVCSDKLPDYKYKLVMMNWTLHFIQDKHVSEEYIRQKEKNLVGVMHTVPVDWYLQSLREIGFTVDIIHADLGFTTFLCSK